MKFYFIDNSTDKEGIINAKNERDALIKLIQIIDDDTFINEIIKSLSEYEIDFRDITDIQEYE